MNGPTNTGSGERQWWGAPDSLPARKNRMVFGCLADTDKALAPAELAALKAVFKGVDMILHAGPVGSLAVIEQLEALAPTAAVGAPAEDSVVRSSTYVRQVLKFGDQSIGLMHGYGKPQGQKAFLLAQFKEDGPEGEKPVPIQALVFGHNREGQARPGGGVFFLNPGSFRGLPPEGKKSAKRTVGMLYLTGRVWEGHISVL
jgi:uncharacterized protein